jgi:DNA helicase-2/ATP-dependent DNA helicase PcrA
VGLIVSRWHQGLNKEQLKAVKTLEGPVLVLAGAGSGKTRVITHRIASMLETGIPAGNILAVTFTNKAAAEMRERISKMVGQAAGDVTLCTFHSLGLKILQEEARRSRRNKRFVIFDTGDQLACLRELAKKIRLDKSFDLSAVLARISAYKNSFLEPGQIEVDEFDDYESISATFYPAYQEALESFSAVDFDDLICRPCKMMEKSASCKKRWAERFSYVLVDEYQDTNSAQFRLLRAIAGKHLNLCVVGDDDQSIYGWRGAEVKNILNFKNDFPGTKSITLVNNYRSSAQILNLANYVISKNPTRHPKELNAVLGEGSQVREVVCEDGDREVEWVADQIEQELSQRLYKASQTAVLYRSNTLARGLETAFRSHKIPYRVLGGKSFFDRKEVKDLTAYLRYCVFPNDSISLRRIINWPARGIGPTTMLKLGQWADDHKLPLHQALEKAESIFGTNDRTTKAIARFNALIRTTRKQVSRQANFVAGVRQLIDQIGMHEEILKNNQSGKAVELRWGSVLDFLNGIESYCKNTPKPSLRDFCNQISLVEREKDKDEEKIEEQVTLSTLHGVKGLEFRKVYIIGMEEGILPHDRVMNPHLTDLEGGDISEERRLCYVGITRAKEELVLTRALERQVFGKMSERAPSRFICDLPQDLLVTDDLTQPASADTAKSHLAAIKALLGD